MKNSSVSDRPPVAPYRVRLLGRPGVIVDGTGAPDETASILGPGKPLVLLARLLVEPDGLSRDALTALLWPNTPEARARASLRQALSRLRQLLGADVLEAGDALVVLAQPLSSDVAAFQDALAAHDDEGALALYGGPFLDGVSIGDANDAEEWIERERRRLGQLMGLAVQRVVRSQLERGQPEVALPFARQLRDTTPDEVASWKPLLELLARGSDPHPLQRELEALRARLSTGGLEHADSARALLARYDATLNAADLPPLTGAATLSRTRFVGRDAELAQLHTAWMVTTQRGGTRRLVCGPAGVGKSRLIDEFCRRPKAERPAMVAVRARRVERDDRYVFLGDVVQALVALPGSMGVSQGSATALVELIPSLARLYPGATWHERTGDRDRQLMLALGDLLAAVTDEKPLLLVLEDVHWSDGASLGVLDRATARLGTSKALVIASSRLRSVSDLDGWDSVTVGPLTADDMGRMLAPLGTPPVDEAVAELVHRVTGGIPLYAQQAMHIMADRGQVQQLHGRWELTGLHIPSDALSSQLLLDSRVRMLPVPAMQLLTYLSLADGPVSMADLLRMHPDAVALARDLKVLDEADFVVAQGDERWAIAHDLVADVVLHQAPLALRRDVMRHLAMANEVRAETLADIRRVVRWYLDADCMDAMLHAVRRWRARTVDAPSGEALADLLLGPDASPTLRRRVTASFPRAVHSPRLTIAIVALVLAVMAIVVPYLLRRPSQLALVNSPIYSITDLQAVSPIFEVRNALGDVSFGLDGRTATASLVSGADSITGGSTSMVRDGQLSLDSLRVWDSGPKPHGQVALLVRVSVPGVPDVVVNLHPLTTDSLWLDAGVLAGQRLSATKPTIHIAPGDSVTGWLRVRYNTPYAGLTVVLSQFTTWREPRTDTVSVASLLTQVRAAWLQHDVRYKGPSTPGVYWLVWTMAAEPAAVWINSGTNWYCGTPVWGDGNDLAATDTAVLANAWGGGLIAHRRLVCSPRPEEPPHFEETRRSSVAVRVLVQ